MKLTFRRFDLQLAHRWPIASGLGPGGSGGTNVFKVVFVALESRPLPRAKPDRSNPSTLLHHQSPWATTRKDPTRVQNDHGQSRRDPLRRNRWLCATHNEFRDARKRQEALTERGRPLTGLLKTTPLIIL